MDGRPRRDVVSTRDAQGGELVDAVAHVTVVLSAMQLVRIVQSLRVSFAVHVRQLSEGSLSFSINASFYHAMSGCFINQCKVLHV